MAIGTRREQTQRVITLAPAVADPFVPLDDLETDAGSAESMADRQPGLTGSDDQDVDGRRRIACVAAGAPSNATAFIGRPRSARHRS